MLLAQDAPRAVVIRRGPTDWSRLSLWHTDTDTFEHGQWFHGRVFERRSDLSPDGELMLTFVHKIRADAPADSWLTLSRPPYFTALAVWFVGGTWATGGLFRGSRSAWLGFDVVEPDRGALVRGFEVSTRPPEHFDRSLDWTDRTVHLSRLAREGWEHVRTTDDETVWRRRLPDGGETLELAEHLLVEGHAIRREVHLAVIDEGRRELGVFDWGGWDHAGRLVGARNGCLLELDGRGGERLLCSFVGQIPEPEAAPAWALRWP